MGFRCNIRHRAVEPEMGKRAFFGPLGSRFSPGFQRLTMAITAILGRKAGTPYLSKAMILDRLTAWQSALVEHCIYNNDFVID
jgi:hypothetical protein